MATSNYVNVMISAPNDSDELQQRIEQEFGIIYTSQQSNDLATEIVKYFVHHQFDEWQDIVDDISNGYDSCCCKEVLFKQLNITNIQQKQNEYNRLNQCLNAPTLSNQFIKQSTPTPQSNASADDIIKDVTKCINEYFVNYFDKQIGNEISTSFQYIVEDDEFTEIELIKDDIEIVDDSGILSYIIDQIEPKLNSYDKQKEITMIKTEICKIIMQKYNNQSTPKQLNPPIIKSRKKKKSKVENIETRILDTFKQEYNEKIAMKIFNAFHSVIIEQKYNFEGLVDDVEDIDDSETLSRLDDIEEIANDGQYDLDHIKITIRDIIIRKTKFNITKFEFKVTQNDIGRTEKLVTKHCQNIYKHSMGIKLKPFNKPGPDPESQSLTIAKSVDIKNVKPIMYWLLNLYSKERSAKYRDGLDPSQGYNSTDWWLENKYCRWIQKNHQKQAKNIKIGIAELIKRALPVINYHNTVFAIICDRLNDFARYALVFHQVAYNMKRLMRNDKIYDDADDDDADDDDDIKIHNVAPIQIDYWIIPQMTKGGKGKNPFQITELKGRAKNPDKINYETKQEYNKLSQNDANEFIWDIKQVLDHPKLGNIEGEDGDYLLEEAQEEFEKLHRQLWHMICKYQKWNQEEEKKDEIQQNVSGQRRNRYIFIIDRRNPNNLKEQNLSIEPVIQSKKPWPDKIYLVKPKQYRNENGKPLCLCGAELKKIEKSLISNRNTKCGWCQKVMNTKKVWQCPRNNNNKKISVHGNDGYYLCIDDSDSCQKARPNTYGKLPTEWAALPESCLGLSKNHILYNAQYNSPVSIKMDDALNGYKFGFSYHLLGEDDISVYWYNNAGGTKFALNDIKWAFPRFFEKINNNEQKLDESIREDIDNYDKLPNIAFDEFEKQANNLKDD